MLKTRLKAVQKAGGDEKEILTVKPFFIFGAPGIGKTMIVAQVLDELSKELSLSHPLNLHNVDGEYFIPFPSMPNKKDIVNYGITREKQFFKRTTYEINGKNYFASSVS